jgi:hypothetical protein
VHAQSPTPPSPRPQARHRSQRFSAQRPHREARTRIAAAQGRAPELADASGAKDRRHEHFKIAGGDLKGKRADRQKTRRKLHVKRVPE